ncbi:hypothetical protein CR205_09430 [Alteribacter lacisalsi]|uniref:DUF2536 family protein n=1 Tax=Alteribacter lacisalsi TaxID=2045244 RepID=A0A2W0HA89_9BACI|nr:DUF2536 family protein [Alteribacter lacisalsi]PYZ98773.1 hypothetical protein CR205_09430 [Alteribacter lacisalsi]
MLNKFDSKKGVFNVILHTDSIKDKIEFFEAASLVKLENQIQRKIDDNQALMLGVHHVSHQVTQTEKGQRIYSAVVHFKKSV